MAKIELKRKLNKSYPNLLLISGGPGLSPLSFLSLENELEGVNVYSFYPSGTDESKTEKNLSYDELLAELKEATKTMEDFYVCGHSFGGIQATELALRNDPRIKGLICLATPFLEETFKAIGDNFLRLRTKDESSMDDVFDAEPTDTNYSKWFASYARLYFTSSNIEAGKAMLLKDKMNVHSYLGARSESSKKGFLLEKIKKTSLKKLFIAGSDDVLLPPFVLKKDSEEGGFVFKTIEKAGHFVHFDQNKKTAMLIRDFIFSKE